MGMFSSKIDQDVNPIAELNKILDELVFELIAELEVTNWQNISAANLCKVSGLQEIINSVEQWKKWGAIDPEGRYALNFEEARAEFLGKISSWE